MVLKTIKKKEPGSLRFHRVVAGGKAGPWIECSCFKPTANLSLQHATFHREEHGKKK